MKISPVVKALGINFAVGIGMHVLQKYTLHAVDTLDYKIRKRRHKPIGFR